MPATRQTPTSKTSASRHSAPQSGADLAPTLQIETATPLLIQRALSGRHLLSPADVQQLQRTIGNRAAGRLLAQQPQTSGQTHSTPILGPGSIQTGPSHSNESSPRQFEATQHPRTPIVQRQVQLQSTSEPLIQRDYNNKIWTITKLLDNIEATAYGHEVVELFNEVIAELKIPPDLVRGPRGMIGTTTEGQPFVMVDGNLTEGEATQQLVQELSNFTMRNQLNRLQTMVRSGQVTKPEAYVEMVERAEWIGASGSRAVFQEAQTTNAEWTRGGASRWGEEVDSWEAYWNNLQHTNPGHLEHLQQRFHSLRAEGQSGERSASSPPVSSGAAASGARPSTSAASSSKATESTTRSVPPVKLGSREEAEARSWNRGDMFVINDQRFRVMVNHIGGERFSKGEVVVVLQGG